jgi:CRISPR-associated protein Csm1
MDNIREHIYLAALLHDIGKFYQRADISFSEKFIKKEYEQSRKIADFICPPTNGGNFGYQHTIWTHQFLVDIENQIKKIPEFQRNPFENTNPDSLFQLASYHHSPSSKLQGIITMADWWSAGIDRVKPTENENGDGPIVKWGTKKYKKIPLYSVFNKIQGGNYQSAFGLRPLSIEEKDFFPRDIKNIEDGISEEVYKQHWTAFKKEIENLPSDSFEGFAESLLFLLKKYTWCIPSDTTTMPNVSLYDHLKTTAAFADSIYVYMQEHPNDLIWDNKKLYLAEEKKPVILLGGDISGIQKFIYNIASSQAAVSLKGRSFYLQLLIDSIIQRIISHKDIKATLGHVLYSSGGKFYMILPNTEKVINAVLELKKEIEKDLWNKHKGQLVINIDYIPFAYNLSGKGIDFEKKTNQPIGLLWKALADKLSKQKNIKFKELILAQYNQFLEVQQVGGRTKVCSVTGIEETEFDKCVLIDKEQKTFVLTSVKEQANLGKTLKDADYIITYRSGDKESNYLNNRSKCNISIVGTSNYLFDKQELIIDDADFRLITSADTSRVKWINKTNYLDAKIKGDSVSYGFQFYGGNEQAKNKDNSLKTFEKLADGSYLGVLRMDVDFLGKIFIQGLPDDNKSFSFYSTLSFMLDYFFSGFLNTIRGRECFKDYVNVIYSGGDDIFAVGRWNKLIDFAEAVRKEFCKFVGRDDITISGGISIVSEKFPIAKAAQLAGEAEENAKKSNPLKNSFNLFGENISWNKEFDYVHNWKEEFVSRCGSNSVPRSILHKIMQFAQIIKQNKQIEQSIKDGKETKKNIDLSYIWNTTYFLTRFYDDKNLEIKKWLQELLIELSNTRKYELIAIAARWAELELKNNNQ